MKRKGLENRRLAQRHLFYFKMGWSMYLWYVIDFIASLTVIYVLLVGNIPGLQGIFPDILRFALAALLAIFLLSDMIGWLHYHNLGTYAAEQDIATESSPYTTEMVVKSLLPFMHIVYQAGKERGFHLRPDMQASMKQADAILRKSDERWAEKSKKK
jgi:type III secretory pathway component EscR